MISSQNIAALFANAAGLNPGRTAFIHDGNTISFDELNRQVMRTAASYSRKGIQKGDKVLVFVPMSIDLYRVVLALFYIGACPVFLDEWVSMSRLKQCCDVVPCKAIVANRKFIFLTYFIAPLRKIPLKIRSTLLEKESAEIEPIGVDSNDTALITFTTGTTGMPKAADRTHGFLHAQYDALLPLVDNGAEKSMVLLPIVVLINLGLGKTTVLPSKKFVAKRTNTINHLANDITDNKADEMIGSPAIIQRMAAYIKQHNFDASGMQHILTGGGAVFPDMAGEISDAFASAACTVVYGSTESEPISHLNMKMLAEVRVQNVYQKGLMVGMPDTAISLTIIPVNASPIGRQTKKEFSELRLPVNAIGEIVVTGAHVLKSYINNEEAIAKHKINVEGTIWHRTGDAGRLDENRVLYLFGPFKEVILYEGHTYHPLISCYVLQQMTGVARAALLLHDRKLTLVIENPASSKEHLQTALYALNLTAATIIYLDKVPTDPRHQTKVDYEALKRKLDRIF